MSNTGLKGINIPHQRPIIQGDIVLKRIDTVPDSAVLTKNDVKVLQHSEISGNHHQFTPESRVNLYQVEPDVVPGIATITDNKGKIIEVLEPSYLFHGKLFDHNPSKIGTGDHASILVQPGVYVVDVVREFDYNFHETRRVVD